MATLPFVSYYQWCGEWKPQDSASEDKVRADWLEERGCPKEYTDQLRNFST